MVPVRRVHREKRKVEKRRRRGREVARPETSVPAVSANYVCRARGDARRRWYWWWHCGHSGVSSLSSMMDGPAHP